MPFRMRSVAVLSVIVAVGVLAAAPLSAQKIDEAKRIRNREQLLTVLRAAADATHMTFERSKVNQFNYSAYLTVGLKYAESVEVVIGATDVDTIFMRAFPKVQGRLHERREGQGPDRLDAPATKAGGADVLLLGDDAQGDLFWGYTFTLEYGFPVDSIRIVLRSVQTHDRDTSANCCRRLVATPSRHPRKRRQCLLRDGRDPFAQAGVVPCPLPGLQVLSPSPQRPRMHSSRTRSREGP